MIEISGEPIALGQLLSERAKGVGQDLDGATTATTYEVVVMGVPMQFVLDMALAEIGPRDETEVGQEFEVAIHHGFIQGRKRPAGSLQNLVSGEVLVVLGQHRQHQ